MLQGIDWDACWIPREQNERAACLAHLAISAQGDAMFLDPKDMGRILGCYVWYVIFEVPTIVGMLNFALGMFGAYVFGCCATGITPAQFSWQLCET